MALMTIETYLNAYKLFERSILWSVGAQGLAVLACVPLLKGRLDYGVVTILAAVACAWRSRVLLTRGRRVLREGLVA